MDIIVPLAFGSSNGLSIQWTMFNEHCSWTLQSVITMYLLRILSHSCRISLGFYYFLKSIGPHSLRYYTSSPVLLFRLLLSYIHFNKIRMFIKKKRTIFWWKIYIKNVFTFFLHQNYAEKNVRRKTQIKTGNRERPDSKI